MISNRQQFTHGDGPIGVFDSGVGGLSVVRRLLDTVPAEDIDYFADTQHVPYGGRPLAQIKEFALAITGFLVQRGAKMVVMACNISSATALQAASAEFPNIPILGVIEPGAEAATSRACHSIGVLATEGTVRTGAYPEYIHKLSPRANVHQVACPDFVPLVEACETESAEADQACMDALATLAHEKCDVIILGCTHYPFLAPALGRAAKRLFPANNQPVLVDPAIATAERVRAILSPNANTEGRRGSLTCTASGDPDHFRASARLFLGKDLSFVYHASPAEEAGECALATAS
jgi:glutamate racemase